jgi:hypothetical protein
MSSPLCYLLLRWTWKTANGADLSVLVGGQLLLRVIHILWLVSVSSLQGGESADGKFAGLFTAVLLLPSESNAVAASPGRWVTAWRCEVAGQTQDRSRYLAEP